MRIFNLAISRLQYLAGLLFAYAVTAIIRYIYFESIMSSDQALILLSICFLPALFIVLMFSLWRLNDFSGTKLWLLPLFGSWLFNFYHFLIIAQTQGGSLGANVVNIHSFVQFMAFATVVYLLFKKKNPNQSLKHETAQGAAS